MRLLIKYLLNNLKKKKFRTALIVVFLMLCNFLIISNLGMNDYYDKAYSANVAYEKGKVDLVITSASSDEEKAEDTTEEIESNSLFKEGEVKLPEESVSGYFEVIGGLGKTIRGDNSEIKVNMVGVSLNSLIQEEMIRGVEADEDAKNYVVLSESACETLGKKQGDEIIVDVLGEEHTLKITHVAEKSGVFAGDSENSISLVMDIAKVQDYYFLEDEFSSIYVSVKDDADIDAVVQKIKDLNMKDKETTVSVTESFDQEAYTQKKSATSLALMVAMLIMLFISVYLISFISKIMFLERMHVMGTFQSVGATPLQTAMIFIGENICYGVLGWIGGIVLSIVLCPRVFSMLNTFQTGEEIDSSIAPVYYIVALICSVAIMFLCSIGSVIRMNQKTVKELLISNNKEDSRMHIQSIIAGLVLAGVAYAMYVRNTSYNLILGVGCFVLAVVSSIILCKAVVFVLTLLYDLTLGQIFKRAYHFGVDNLRRDKMLGGSVTLITIVVSMFLCIVMVILSVKSSMENMIDNNDFDISCVNLSSDLSDYDDVVDLEGVKETYFDYIYNTKAQIGDQQVGITVVGLDDEENFYHFHSQSITYEREQARKLVEGRYVLVDSFWADKNGVSIGDAIQITDKESGEVSKDSYEVTGFINSSGFTTSRDAVLIGQKYLDQDLDIQPYQYLIKVAEGYEIGNVAGDVADELIETTTVVKTITEVVNDSMSGVDSLIIILYLIIGISVLLVIFGVINNITVSFLSRKRELAILYSTAMSKNQLIVMFYGEIMTMYVIIMLYSTVLTYIYQYVMPKILWSAGLAFKIQFPMQALITTAAALFLILNMLVVIPVVNLLRMNTVDVLKYE